MSKSQGSRAVFASRCRRRSGRTCRCLQPRPHRGTCSSGPQREQIFTQSTAVAARRLSKATVRAVISGSWGGDCHAAKTCGARVSLDLQDHWNIAWRVHDLRRCSPVRSRGSFGGLGYFSRRSTRRAARTGRPGMHLGRRRSAPPSPPAIGSFGFAARLAAPRTRSTCARSIVMATRP